MSEPAIVMKVTPPSAESDELRRGERYQNLEGALDRYDPE